MKWVKIRQKSGKKIHLVASKIGKNKKKVKNAFADQKRRKKGEKNIFWWSTKWVKIIFKEMLFSKIHLVTNKIGINI